VEKIVSFWEEGKGDAKNRLILYNCTSGYPVRRHQAISASNPYELVTGYYVLDVLGLNPLIARHPSPGALR
jgi:hypothetical protein